MTAQIDFHESQSRTIVWMDGGLMMLMGDFIMAIKYGIHINVIVIKNGNVRND